MFNKMAFAWMCGTLLALFRHTVLSEALIIAVAMSGVACLCVRRLLALLLACLLLSFAWGVFYSQQAVNQWLPEAKEGEAIVVSGHITDFPRPSDDDWQFDFLPDAWQGKIRLTAKAMPEHDFPSFSCRYRLRVKLKQPRGLLNFNQYDYQAWLLQADYVATGYVQVVEACDPLVPNVFLRWRQHINTALAAADLSNYASSTLSALLIGNYAGIDSVQWRVLRDSGTIHLLSVSGLHIVLVAVLFHFLVRCLVRFAVFPLHYWPADHWASVAALGAAIFYALLTGFSVATQRSLIMVAVAVLQRIVYGKFRVSFIFLLSLVLVVIVNPLSMLSVSFWFTYLATAALLLASNGAEQRDLSWIYRYFFEPLRLQLTMFLVMMPVLLFVYGRVSLLSLPLNLLAVPWVSFISLPCGFAALILMPVSRYLSNMALQIAGWSLDVYWRVMQDVLRCLGEWQLQMGGIRFTTLLLSLSGVCLLCFGRRYQRWRFLGLVLCVCLFLPQTMPVPEKAVDVQVLDVGQGLAVILRTRHHTLVYDTGDKHSERFDAGRDIVATALRNWRIPRITMLVISHADSDHAGGREGLLSEIAAQQKWSGTPDQLHDREYFPCSAGMHWRWDGVDFQVLYPIENSRSAVSDNNRSCVIRVDAGGRRLLLTGDVEKNGEQQMLNAGTDLRADILVAPHHGSKTSSSSALLSAVGAKTVVVSAGYRNRFHHPARAVSERYTHMGMTILNTAEVGAVQIRLSTNEIQIKKALCEQSVFWREARYNAHCSHVSITP